MCPVATGSDQLCAAKGVRSYDWLLSNGYSHGVSCAKSAEYCMNIDSSRCRLRPLDIRIHVALFIPNVWSPGKGSESYVTLW